MEALIDNDVLFKAACYNLFPQLLNPIAPAPNLGVLGAARYVGRRAIAQAELIEDRTEAIARLENFIDAACIVEPTDDEQVLAADFEEAAQRRGVPVDEGESQLCALLIARSINWLCTGDKRAIEALEVLLSVVNDLSALCGRIICLEQMAVAALSVADPEMIRSVVCAEPGVDRTLTICFSCKSEEIALEAIIEGLTSYINDLRSKAPNILSS